MGDCKIGVPLYYTQRHVLFSYVQVKAGFYYSVKLSNLHVIFKQENLNFVAVLP